MVVIVGDGEPRNDFVVNGGAVGVASAGDGDGRRTLVWTLRVRPNGKWFRYTLWPPYPT